MAYQLYARRWLVVAAFAMVSFSNNWIWITWSPIATLVAAYWNVPISSVDTLSGIYMYVYLPGICVAMYLMVDVLGLSRAMWIASAMNATGAIIRFFGMSSYRWVFFGTLLNAVTQTFTLAAPSFLAAKWFGAHESATATAIGVLSNQFGGAVGLGSTILVNFTNPNGSLNLRALELLLFVQMAVAVGGFVTMVSFLRTDNPPTPPNASAAARLVGKESTVSEETPLQPVEDDAAVQDKINDGDADPSFWQSLKLAVRHGLVFALVFGVTVGTFYSIPPFISQFVPTWTRQESGWLGFSYQMTGVIGSFIIGRVVDRFQNHSIMSRTLLALSLVFLGGFWIIHGTNTSPWLVFATMMGTGFSLAASSSLGYELGASITYPANEATVGALFQVVTNLFSSLCIATGSWISAGSSFIGVMWGGLAVALLLLLSIPTESNRPKDPTS